MYLLNLPKRQLQIMYFKTISTMSSGCGPTTDLHGKLDYHNKSSAFALLLFVSPSPSNLKCIITCLKCWPNLGKKRRHFQNYINMDIKRTAPVRNSHGSNEYIFHSEHNRYPISMLYAILNLTSLGRQASSVILNVYGIIFM